MLTIDRPTNDRLRDVVTSLGHTELTYTPGLLDRVDKTPQLPGGVAAWSGDGWFVDRFDEVVGHGEQGYEAACDALREWAMFDQPWLRVVSPPVALDVGNDVAYSARVLGTWWTYGCRILEMVDETDRFGFVYGTLADHAERGEELFQVRRLADGDVEFSLFAMSRPGRWFSWPGMPIARASQARFRPGAAAGMRHFVDRRRAGEVTS